MSIAQCYPYHVNPSPLLAQQITRDCKQQLPLLNNIIVLMPNYHASSQLREHLTAEAHKLGFDTLLGPQIYTLKDYIEKNTLIDKKRIPTEARELILVQALEENRGLFGEQNLLTVAYSLLELFDELTRHQIALPSSTKEFIKQLEQAYQCSDTKISALSREATIIHTLWQAWHEQLAADDLLDLESIYQLKLAQNLSHSTNPFFYIAGYYEFLPSEIQWVNTKLKQKKACLIFHGESKNYGLHPASTLFKLFSTLKINPDESGETPQASCFLDTVYHNQDLQFSDRTVSIKQEMESSPIVNKISTFEASTFEGEAKAIELQVRAWMADNKRHIALIIEDRMLARRVRALLDQSGIGLKDMEGWALSTSSASSVIESWLQTIEEKFHHLPLLDVIKSPYSLNNIEISPETIYRFEQDIIQHENINNDLDRYINACKYRLNRINFHNSKTTDNIITLLSHIKASAQPLHDLLSKPHKISVYIDALIDSLHLLGSWESLQEDQAGEVITTLLVTLKESVRISDIDIDWISFRHWFGKKLEENTFRPESNHNYYVELLHLTQSTLGHYEALIIGSLTQDTFPGSAKQTPFFNQSVRAELNLPSTQLQIQHKFYHFRRLLESAPNVLLTMHKGSQENLPSAWLTLLKNFHQLTFDESLENNDLHEWIKTSDRSSAAKTENSDSAVIHQQHLPKSISASSHQTLINCPYAFFAAQILKLRAQDEIRETLAKSDYGERVHLCLQAFHSGDIKKVSGPFKKVLSVKNRESAIAMLTTISNQVFSKDVEDNFQHRGWLKRWIIQIPKFIDWEIERSNQWRFKSGEFKAENWLIGKHEINGRIDRMDTSKNGLGIIDYKTGKPPRPIDVELGEAVQLIHYALAVDDNISQIEYLSLEDQTSKKVISKCILENEDLADLKEKAKNRLVTLFKAAEEGKALTPWGTDSTCEYCSFNGICRKQFLSR